jgi:hypothetical protein
MSQSALVGWKAMIGMLSPFGSVGGRKVYQFCQWPSRSSQNRVSEQRISGRDELTHLSRIGRVVDLAIVGDHVRSVLRERVDGKGEEVLLRVESFPGEAFVGGVPDGIVRELNEKALR